MRHPDLTFLGFTYILQYDTYDLKMHFDVYYIFKLLVQLPELLTLHKARKTDLDMVVQASKLYLHVLSSQNHHFR